MSRADDGSAALLLRYAVSKLILVEIHKRARKSGGGLKVRRVFLYSNRILFAHLDCSKVYIHHTCYFELIIKNI